MTLQPDDPKLTAYALGELDAAEAAAVAAAIEASPECRQALEEIREATATLQQALDTEPVPALSPAQRESIESAVSAEPQPRGQRKAAFSLTWLPTAWFVSRGPAFALTACLLAAVCWMGWVTEVGKPKVNQAASVSNQTNVMIVAGIAPSVLQERKPRSAGGSLVMSDTDSSGVIISNGMVTVGDGGAGTLDLNGAAPVSVVGGPLAFNGGSINGSMEPPPAANACEDRLVVSSGSKSYGTGTVDLNGAGSAPATLAKNGAGQLILNGGSLNGSSIALGGTLLSGTLYRSPSPYAVTVSPDTESYPQLTENRFRTVAEEPLSTFSADVDTASYSNVRRFLLQGMLPPKDAVRIEEMINYFPYDYAPPTGKEPFSVSTEVADCPWNAEHRLVRIGIKGKVFATEQQPPANLVFLIDVSGSMADARKLELIKPALHMLVEKLTERDRVAIVVYADYTRLVLPSTPGNQKDIILNAIDNLQASGSTNGGQGIQQAYEAATQNFIKGGVNRVILCTDGDFNVGIVRLDELTQLIEDEAKRGVFLSVLGFGMGNLKDATMEKLADKGHGNYAYIDTIHEARKVLSEQVSGTLITIAKDVKLQLEFNPAKVAGYRLVGYEDRLLRKQDFNNDRKTGGDIGAGHTVTALYEIVPSGKPVPGPSVDPLKYQRQPQRALPTTGSSELCTVKLRYKQPDGDKSSLIERAVVDGGSKIATASADYKFAAAVAAFGMILRDSEQRGEAGLAMVLDLAEQSRGPDKLGYRVEFLSLVKKAQALLQPNNRLSR